jgi:hypothetical protein
MLQKSLQNHIEAKMKQKKHVKRKQKEGNKHYEKEYSTSGNEKVQQQQQTKH